MVGQRRSQPATSTTSAIRAVGLVEHRGGQATAAARQATMAKQVRAISRYRSFPAASQRNFPGKQLEAIFELSD